MWNGVDASYISACLKVGEHYLLSDLSLALSLISDSLEISFLSKGMSKFSTSCYFLTEFGGSSPTLFSWKGFESNFLFFVRLLDS